MRRCGRLWRGWWAGRARYVAMAILAAVAMVGCEKEKTFEPPDRDERIAAAETRFAETEFDTITWADETLRVRDGNSVYAAKCRNCHGTLGRGSTAYAANRGLEVPSLVEPEWRYAASLDSVRHRVFVGHRAGMPTWGVAGITLREIDAVSAYILDDLRPEVLGGAGR